jgi:hypothetical protein
MVLQDRRERSRDEFADLFALAGLRLTSVISTRTLLSVVEAIPV